VTVDTVNQQLGDEPGQLDALLAAPGLPPSMERARRGRADQRCSMNVLENSARSNSTISPLTPPTGSILLSHDWAYVRQYHFIPVPSVWHGHQHACDRDAETPWTPRNQRLQPLPQFVGQDLLTHTAILEHP
jgi:hypothetical protein